MIIMNHTIKGGGGGNIHDNNEPHNKGNQQCGVHNTFKTSVFPKDLALPD